MAGLLCEQHQLGALLPLFSFAPGAPFSRHNVRFGAPQRAQRSPDFLQNIDCL
jgi:hypothetical protein